MLDIIRPAYTVGITTVRAPIGRSEAFSISNWIFFSTIEIVNVRLLCTSEGRMRGWEALRHVDVSTFGGYECFIGLFSPFPFVFRIRMRIRGRFNAFCADVISGTFAQPLSGFLFCTFSIF